MSSSASIEEDVVLLGMSRPVFRNETPKLRFCNFDEQLLIA